MKIVVLSGAIKNAGDFLITERTKELLLSVYPIRALLPCLEIKK